MEIINSLWKKSKIRLVKIFFCPMVLLWVLRSRLYWISGHLEFNKVELDKKLPLTGASSKIQLIEWRPEGDLWSLCQSPGYVQFLVNLLSSVDATQEEYERGAEEKIDCKSLAHWVTQALDRSFFPATLIFRWVNPGGEVSGHTMCVCRRKDGRVFCIDSRGVSAAYTDVNEICRELTVSTGSTEPVGWALLDKNLNILGCGRGYPNGGVY